MTTLRWPIRYLTGGVLARVNRHTQELEPELAESWKVSQGQQANHLQTPPRRSLLRWHPVLPPRTLPSPCSGSWIRRVALRRLETPSAPAAGAVATKMIAPDQISVTFPAPVVGLDRLFDQVAIMSAHSPKKEAAVLGPFMVAEYKAGSSVRLERNPYYWKKDAQGRRLPYLDSIQLDIQSNRDVEMLRFKRGELDLINALDTDYFDRLGASFAATRA